MTQIAVCAAWIAPAKRLKSRIFAAQLFMCLKSWEGLGKALTLRPIVRPQMRRALRQAVSAIAGAVSGSASMRTESVAVVNASLRCAA